jgi:hypothetical protein
MRIATSHAGYQPLTLTSGSPQPSTSQKAPIASNECRGSVRDRTWPLSAARSIRHRHGSAAAAPRATSCRQPAPGAPCSQDPQDSADDQQYDHKLLQDPDPGEVAEQQQEQTEISTLLPPPPHLPTRCAEGPGAARTLLVPTPTCQSNLAGPGSPLSRPRATVSARSSTGRPLIEDPAPSAALQSYPPPPDP